jgi:hypothetical protein
MYPPGGNGLFPFWPRLSAALLVQRTEWYVSAQFLDSQTQNEKIRVSDFVYGLNF